MKRSGEDDSEINWVDNDNDGDYEENVPAEEGEEENFDDDDESGFDLRSTGSMPLLHQHQRQRQRQQRSGTGNQKGIKLNSNYHEDAEIGALNRARGRTSGKNKGVREDDEDCVPGGEIGREFDDTECRSYSAGSNCGGGSRRRSSSSGSNNNGNGDANDREADQATQAAGEAPSVIAGDELETVILRLTTRTTAEGVDGTLATTACVT